MPKYGTGIDMKHFGSEFDGGFVKTKYDEQPVKILQGMNNVSLSRDLSHFLQLYECCVEES